MDKIKITFFGVGCHVIKGNFKKEVWADFKNQAKAINYSLEDAFFEDSFYSNLKCYTKWTDLGNTINVSGLLDSYQSIIEIKINNKKKAKIPFNVLLNNSFLFPLYQTSIKEINNSEYQPLSLTLVEKEIGTISSYKFDVANFSIDKLYFTIAKLSLTNDLHYTVLTKIQYDNKELKSKIPDTLVRERFTILS